MVSQQGEVLLLRSCLQHVGVFYRQLQQLYSVADVTVPAYEI